MEKMVTVKISKNIGLKVGETKKGIGIFENAFKNLSETEGTEVQISEKDVTYIKGTITRVLKCQKILDDLLNTPENQRFDYDLKVRGGK